MHYPFLHRGMTLGYCWSCNTPSITNFNFVSRSPNQLGADKYSKLSDVLYDESLPDPLEGIGTRRIVFNYNITSYPFPSPYPFSGWTYEALPTPHYFNNAFPSIKWYATDTINFSSKIEVFIHFFRMNSSSQSIIYRPNQRYDRRNSEFFYSINARMRFSLSFGGSVLEGGGGTGRRPASFDIIGNIGPEDYADDFFLFWGDPFSPADVFEPLGPKNNGDFKKICPLPTISNCNQNVCSNIEEILDNTQSRYVKDDFSYTDSLGFLLPTSPNDYPLEVYNYLLDSYNSVKNISLNINWKLAALPYFIPDSVPNKKILTQNDNSWGVFQNNWLN